MKFTIFVYTFCFLFFNANSQLSRKEVEAKVSSVFKITDNQPLFFKTSNYELEKDLINASLSPLVISVYRFNEEGENEPIYTVTETYFHTDRDLVKIYSNEQEPQREDYVTFWLSQVATHTHGEVLQNAEGIYYTTQVWFNLE